MNTINEIMNGVLKGLAIALPNSAVYFISAILSELSVTTRPSSCREVVSINSKKYRNITTESVGTKISVLKNDCLFFIGAAFGSSRFQP